MEELQTRLSDAIKHFWRTRADQARTQGRRSGRRDQGARSAVTGGAQLDGFVSMFRDLLRQRGVPESDILTNSRIELPGYFRPEKQWDLLVISRGNLIAALEFKSQVGPSFGNNYNNRTEEAIGNATDLWSAYREGAFRSSPRPWLGYLMLLEDTTGSQTPVSVKEPHFVVFPEFHGASYAKRYEVFLTRLVRERLYDATCLVLSARTEGLSAGAYSEPSIELGIRNMVMTLIERCQAHSQLRDS